MLPVPTPDGMRRQRSFLGADACGGARAIVGRSSDASAETPTSALVATRLRLILGLLRLSAPDVSKAKLRRQAGAARNPKDPQHRALPVPGGVTDIYTSRACALGCADVCGMEGHTQDGQSTTRIGNSVSCKARGDCRCTRCNSGGRAVCDDRKADPEFGDGCRDALADAGDALQAEARNRAYMYFARVSRSRAIARWSVRILGAARLQEGPHRPRNDTAARPDGAERGKRGRRHSGKAA